MNSMIKRILIEKKKEIQKRLGRNEIFLLRSSGKIKSKTKSKSAITHQKNLFLPAPKKQLALIYEIKFASPSAGTLGDSKYLIKIAKRYEKLGADALSIITEEHFFKGNTSFIPKVKKEVDLPVLQKDFVIDESQIYEAKNLGSDALLLIARIVSSTKLNEFVNLCFKLGLEPVVEVHKESDLKKAIKTKTRIIAVNARDLDTFKVDVNKACRLVKRIPTGFTKLGFSGIVSEREIDLYKSVGVKGILIGTALMKGEKNGFFS